MILREVLQKMRKNYYIKVLVSEIQKEIIKKNAELNGYKSTSHFLRDLAINNFPLFIEKFNLLFKKIMEEHNDRRNKST